MKELLLTVEPSFWKGESSVAEGVCVCVCLCVHSMLTGDLRVRNLEVVFGSVFRFFSFNFDPSSLIYEMRAFHLTVFEVSSNFNIQI